MARRRPLVVLFGGRSAEHDVSCVSAAHVASAADPELFDVVPVGIDLHGRWMLAESALAALAAGGPLDRLDPSGSESGWQVLPAGETWETRLSLFTGPLQVDAVVD